ncbi:uncharacterized protein LOC121735842 [Aricia agestis]|uniref:uncharacterized protein LOC121735842 n=1 Tax=Aricia agestis TaxID=91739 RepID=UPI001C205211|nr:uncharacterized protein LOC121735842 [Aricia agestis]
MLYLSVLVALLGLAQAKPGFLFSQPVVTGVQYAEPLSNGVQPHPAVELNAASESQLPPELLKSHDFYSNPSIAAGLAKESWFTKKEMQVVEREAEKIPRQKIYDLVSHAGFLDH